MIVRYLTLWPTAACNLDCAYCYRTPRAGVMDKATASAAIALAAGSGAPFHVQIAGGEPTLVPDLVRHIVRCARSAGGPATLAVQTNGIGLDAGLARFLGGHGVEVGLSLDGPEPVHDAVRGRFRDTLRALAVLAREDVPVRVTAVLTHRNAMHLGDLALLLATFPNVRGLALDPLVDLGSARGRRDLVPTQEDVAAGIRDLHATLGALATRRRAPFSWREQDRVRRALAGAVPGDYCHACRGESLAVGPDGRAYPCAQAIGLPELAAGTLENLDREAIRRGFGEQRLRGPCSICRLRGNCPGDCPSRLRTMPPGGLDPTCLIYRTLVGLESR
jgi:uncharacterized protein